MGTPANWSALCIPPARPATPGALGPGATSCRWAPAARIRWWIVSARPVRWSTGRSSACQASPASRLSPVCPASRQTRNLVSGALLQPPEGNGGWRQRWTGAPDDSWRVLTRAVWATNTPEVVAVVLVGFVPGDGLGGLQA